MGLQLTDPARTADETKRRDLSDERETDSEEESTLDDIIEAYSRSK